MATVLPAYPDAGANDAAPRRLSTLHAPVDQIFRSTARGSGTFVLVIMALVGAFLTMNAAKAISSVGVVKFVTTQEWSPETNHFGIAAVLSGTIMIALVALVVAVPLSLGASLFITEVATGRARTLMTSAIDLMAAVPSSSTACGGCRSSSSSSSRSPSGCRRTSGGSRSSRSPGPDPSNPLPDPSLYTSSTFIAGLIVAMMIIPIQTSMMRMVPPRPAGRARGCLCVGRHQVGRDPQGGAPLGKGGIIGGIMLGLGRALGETIAIYLVISPLYHINFHILQNGSDSVAAMIALRYSEANDFSMSALMAAGLALFLLTMLINFSASTIIARSRSGAESEV